MKQPAVEADVPTTPRFYVTPRQRLSPVPFFLAIVIAIASLVAVLYALNHAGHTHLSGSGSGGSHSGKGGSASGSSDDDNDDDSSAVDTIYLADPSEAPAPTRPSARPSADPAHPAAVHPFVVVRLPRSGPDIGQIPDSTAGHLLYAWLAAFNGKDPYAVATALLTAEPSQTESAQLELRRLTGGFTLVSAREIQPGLLVFRLHDQTASFTEFLGTLQLRQNASPPSIATFSLSQVPQNRAAPAAADAH